MKKLFLTVTAIAGLFAASSSVHASGEGAVCPVTGKTASGEAAKKDGAKKDDAKKEGGSKCCGGAAKK